MSHSKVIPEYAKDFEKEWLVIRGINKECYKLYIDYLCDASELFVTRHSDKIKYYIRRFLKCQERGYIKDTSCFIFKWCDVENIEELFDKMHFDFVGDKEFCENGIDDFYSVDLSGYRDFYELFCKF